jgi:hypothetical protein
LLRKVNTEGLLNDCVSVLLFVPLIVPRSLLPPAPPAVKGLPPSMPRRGGIVNGVEMSFRAATVRKRRRKLEIRKLAWSFGFRI